MSGVFFTADDPLYTFCDAPLHWDCYEHWPGRPRFAREYVSSHVQDMSHNEYWGMALLTDLACLTVRKNEPGQVHLWLFETGTCVPVSLCNWSAWLLDLALTEEELHRVEIVSLWKVLAELRRRFPTSDAILAAIDWDAKDRLAKLKEEERARDECTRPDAIQAHNDACREFFMARGPEGLTCPQCRRPSADIEYVDRTADQRKSIFVCPSCARSFGHDL